MDLILSDIHSNLQALNVVLRYARRRAIQRFVLLGDVVGYGAQPNQVMEKVLGMKPRFIVRGNHDRACSVRGADQHFSLPAKGAAHWTRDRLSRENLRILRNLPAGPLAVGEDYVISHGSPLDEDSYLLHPQDALEAFDGFEGPLCFFGHTHLPCCFELDEVAQVLTPYLLEPGEWFQLKKDCRYLVNPGSVGQPRDRDPRLSFMTYDTRRKRLKLHRLEYDHSGAAREILEARLHPNLAERLFYGI
ncbi:metallophosphoesterase family protein [Holophaga foetida]|uniref:metallophosphoesterase family protein n=1 Tax=Holophaga foetida TaxID=35839 RepID=UPI000247535D|nr:metallophosphoesterase family protein [Holophaga foetida]